MATIGTSDGPRPRRAMPASNSREHTTVLPAAGGFTLIKMLAVLAIMGLMMGLTVGAFNHWGRGSRVKGSVLHLKHSMSMARQFAITKRVRTTFECGNMPNGERGYYSVVRNDTGYQVGATNFLEKPPSEHDLWEAIQEAIQEDRRRRQVLAANRSREDLLSSLEPHEQSMLEMIGQGVAMRDMAESP